MSRRPTHPTAAARWLAGLAILLVGACTAESADPTVPIIDALKVEARGGRGGGNGGGDGKGGGGKSPSVNGANPGSLPKGIVNANLEVVGSGFSSGSEVSFEIDGVATESVVTNSVTFVDETRLIANVDVSTEALETLYDIAVRNGPKKKGVGIELLRVVEALPQVSGTVVPGMPADANVYYAASGRVVGRTDSGCGFVYDVATEAFICLDLPSMQPEQIYALSINQVGRVTGTFYEDGAHQSRVFVYDAPYGPEDLTVLDVPSGFDAMGSASIGDRGVNASGEIVVEFSLDDPDLTTHYDFPKGLGVYSADLQSISSAAGVADFQSVHPVGMNDAGLVAFRGRDSEFNEVRGWWSGVDGASWQSLPLGPVTPRGDMPGISGMTDDGRIYGTRIGIPIVWPSPTTEPVAVADFEVYGLKHDSDGNLLGEGQTNGNRTPPIYCIGTTGVTQLLIPDGFERARARTGADGVIYGEAWGEGSAVTIVQWSVPGGC